MDAIVADLDARRHPFHVAIENWQHDLNIGSIVRSANAFLAETVHIVGPPAVEQARRDGDRPLPARAVSRDDRRASCGWAKVEGRRSSRSTTCRARCRSTARGLPERCILLFGQEGPGLTDAALAARAISTSRSGEFRLHPLSINAAAAAAIVMHEWVRQHV